MTFYKESSTFSSLFCFVPNRMDNLSALHLQLMNTLLSTDIQNFLVMHIKYCLKGKRTFPDSGSPPNKTIDPGTNPPPSTRLSSTSCISILGTSLDDISEAIPVYSSWMKMAEFNDWAIEEPESDAIRISLNVFHCPQLGHLPIHLGESCPIIWTDVCYFIFCHIPVQ